MNDTKFIRVNGRVIPVRSGGGKKKKKQSEFEKAPVTTGLKKGAKIGAAIGAGAGAVVGFSITGLGSGFLAALGKSTPSASEAKAFKTGSKVVAGLGLGVVTPALMAGGAISRGIDGAIIGTGVGLAYAGYKKLKKRKK